MKLSKIEKKDLVSNVAAQSCKNDCQVKVWSGKKEADGYANGCWYTYQYTARWNPFA